MINVNIPVVNSVLFKNVKEIRLHITVMFYIFLNEYLCHLMMINTLIC